MTLLSDHTLLDRLAGLADLPDWQRIRLEPFDLTMLQPCSIDVHLGERLKLYTGPRTDTRRDNSPWWQPLQPADEVANASGQVIAATLPGEPRAWVLQPGRFYLGVLAETIGVPEDCCARLEGISSRARDGVSIHQQAGLLDPGWWGRATLEIRVENPHTVIYGGQRIAQVTFTLLDRRCLTPYAGRYLGDHEPEPARPAAGLDRREAYA